MRKRAPRGDFRHAARASAACVCLALFAAACAGDNHQSALDPAGTQARLLGQLWWTFFYVLMAVWVLVIVAMLLALVRGRRGASAAEAEGPAAPIVTPDAGAERSRARWVGGAVILSAIILFVLLVSSVMTGQAISSMSTGDAVYIEVTGHQWWWEVRYVDPVQSNTFTTANEIHIPVGRPVQLKLRSTDVIHSFWVPNLHGKKDLIPGDEALTVLKADHEGVYRGQCAEFCGYQHAHMAFLVVAEAPEKFAAWQQQQRQSAVAPADPLTQRGQQVFLTSPCIMCHTIGGTPAGATLGPNLTHFGSRSTIAAATLPNTPGHLGGWIADSQTVKPGNRMPPNSLSPDDLQALIAYLESLK